MMNVIREIIGLGPLFDRKRTNAEQARTRFKPRMAEPMPARACRVANAFFGSDNWT